MAAPHQETGILSRAAAREQLTKVQDSFKVWEGRMITGEYTIEAMHFKQHFLVFVEGLLECLAEGRTTLPPYESIIEFIKKYVEVARVSRPRLQRLNGEEWRDMAEELNEFVIMLGLLPIDFGSEKIEEIETSTVRHAKSAVAAEGV